MPSPSNERLVDLVSPEGDVVSAPESQVDRLERGGFRRESTDAALTRQAATATEEQYSSPADKVAAGVYGGLRGLTFGLSDVILRGAGATDEIRNLKKANPTTSLASEILGGVLPSIASGGTGTAGSLARLTPSGALSRGATLVGEGITAGGGTARAIGGTAVSGAIEGGIQNVGSYLSEVALGNKELSAEGVVGSLGKGALFGGAAGATLAGAERGTIAARRMFPKLAGGGKEAAQIAEETFHSGADKMLREGDELEKVARDEVSRLRIRRRELELEREKLRGVKDPAARLRSKEIQLEQETVRADLKALRDAKNTERAAAGLPDLPPDAPLIDTPVPAAAPANDAAPIAPANDVAPLPGAIAPALHGSDDLMARLGATKQALDEGIPFTDIGKAQNDLTVAADNTAHEAGLLADTAVEDAIADLARKEQRLAEFTASHGSAREYAASLKARANQKGTGREVSYRPLQEGSDVLGVGASKRSGKVVTPVGEQEIRARAGDQVFAGVGGDAPAATLTPDIPDGWVTDDLFPKGVARISNELPAPGQIDDSVAYVVRPSQVADTGQVYGNPKLSKTTQREIREEWGRGDKLSPVEAEMDPSGRIWIRDGNHRLSVAAETDRPVVMRIKARKALDDVKDSDRVLVGGRKGADLDAAYEQALTEAADAATDQAQEAALRRAASLEDDILRRVEARGGRDAEYVASIRKAREDVGWTPYEVAVRRVEKRLTGEPMTTGRAAGDEAFDAAIRRSEMEMGETMGQRADTLIGKRTLADDILAGGRTAEPIAPLEMPSQGRLIDSAEQGIKVFDDYERAHHALTQELGAAAPPAAQMHAQQYAAAIDDQARKQTDAMAMQADKAASTVGLPTPPTVSRLPALPSGLASKAADAAAMLELLQSVGDVPFMPDVKHLPVIGPILSMYLKFRGAKAVFNRFGGRIAATTESKAAVRAAELRDRAAGIVDEILEGAGKAAKAAKRPAAVVSVKAFDTLKHSLYPDGEERSEPKNAADATRHRAAELSRVAANPDAVRAAVQAQFQASDPDLVNAVANATLRKLQYLQKNAPKEPPPGPLGSKPWQPSAAEVERFARRVRAAEDPTSVLRDLEQGTVTPEAAEALRAVYPQVFAEVQTRLLTRAAELRAELPRQRVLQLSLLFDAPLDPSLEPSNLAVLQSAHAPTATGQEAGQNAGQPPAPSVARPVNVSRLYSDDRAGR